MGAFSTSYNRPQFVERANNGNNNTRKGFTRPITVTGYDLAKHQILGEHRGIKYAFSVRQDVFLRIEEAMRKKAETAGNAGREQAPYLSHLIDDRMMKAIPVGSVAIVINSEVTDAKNPSGVKTAVIDRVKRFDPTKSKLIEDAIITATAKVVDSQLVVSHFQHFEPKGVSVNDLEGLQVFAKKLDESSQSYGTMIGDKKVVKPGVGARFIVAYPSDEIDEYTQTRVHYVINKTFLFDYINNETDEKGQPIKGAGHLLTGEEMMIIRDQYIEFAQNDPVIQSFAEEVKARDPSLEMLVDVQFYYVYPASGNENNAFSKGKMGTPEYDELNKHIKKNPLYQLTHAKSYLDVEHISEPVRGGNAAIKTCLELTADKPVSDGKGGWVTLANNWAKVLYIDGVRGDSLAMIRGSGGEKLKPHPSLAIIRDDVATTAAPANQTASPYSAAPAPAAPTRPSSYSAAPAAPARTQAPVAQAPAAAPDAFFDIFSETDGDSDAGDSGSGQESSAPAPQTATRAPVRFSSRPKN